MHYITESALFTYLFTVIIIASALTVKDTIASEMSWNNYLEQHSTSITSNGDDGDFSDLATFGEAIKDTRVVLLGEQSHGEENVFELKARLARYLHIHHDFDVLIVESGLYDVDRMNQLHSPKNNFLDQSKGNIYYMYSGSTSFQSLLKYVDSTTKTKNPLLLSGMDSQHTGDYSQEYLVSDLEQALKASGSSLPSHPNWTQFELLSNQLFRLDRSPPPQKDQATYFGLLSQITEYFSKHDLVFWEKISESLKRQAQIYWGHKDPFSRSEIMGENLAWLVNEKFKGKKIMVWAHHGHINRESVKGFPSAGNILSTSLGDEMYVVSFTSNTGNYFDIISNEVTAIKPSSGNTFENYMEEKNYTISFSNWRHLPENLKKDNSLKLREFFYQPLYIDSWQKRIDGTFYVNHIQPLIK